MARPMKSRPERRMIGEPMNSTRRRIRLIALTGGRPMKSRPERRDVTHFLARAMVASDRLERVPLVGGLAAGDGASRRGQPRAAAGFVAGLVALVAVVALATGADAPAHALASLGKASGASMRGSTCESRVRAATADATFYAFDLFAWTPFSARGEREYTLDPPDSDVLAAKTTPAQFMYPEWLRAPLRADKRRVSDPADADLVVVTDSLVDVSPFVAKFAWHATHAGRGDGWAEMDAWWDEKGGDAKGAAVVAEAGRRLDAMRAAANAPGGAKKGTASLPASDDKKFLFMLPSEWMFGKEDVAEGLKVSAAVEKALGGRLMTAVTDFDDGGPNVASVVATVPFATHSSVAAALRSAGGKVDYHTKKRGTFFKGTGVRGLEGSLGRLTEARVALEALVGEKGHDVFLSSDDETSDDATGSRKSHGGYAEGMLSSTFCWVPRGDNPTSRRIFDAVAAGCIPVVVSDDIARYLPFRWAVDWRAMILQVPEAIFARDPKGVAAAVLALPDAVVDALRARMDAARYKLLWNDRAAPTDPPCEANRGNRGKKTPCSEAPRLYMDEMLFRAATGNAEPDAPLCERREGDDAHFLDGSAWNAQGSCPPWLAMRGVCGDKAETKSFS